MNTSKSSNVASLLAEKLQSGWRLLSATCPQCSTPLMREKGSTSARMYCVKCALHVVRESDAEQEKINVKPVSLAAPATSTTSAAASSSSSTTSNKPASEKSLAELESGLVSLSSHQRFSEYQNALREINDGVDGGNAEQHHEEKKEDDDDYEDEYDAQVQADIVLARMNKLKAQRQLDDYAATKKAEKEAALAAEIERFSNRDDDEEAISAHMSHVNALSARIGEKLLQGWSMLGEQCPNERCGAPLLRPKGETAEKPLICMNCGAHVMKEGEMLRIIKQSSKQSLEEKGAGKNNISAATTSAAPQSSQQQQEKKRDPPRRQTRRQRIEEEDDDDDDDDDDAEEEDIHDYVNAIVNQEDQYFNPEKESSARKETATSASDPYGLNQMPNDFTENYDDDYQPFFASSSSTTKKPSQQLDVSSLLGAKMMEGYALLAQHCEKEECSCPLVSKRGGPLICVRCEANAANAAPITGTKGVAKLYEKTLPGVVRAAAPPKERATSSSSSSTTTTAATSSSSSAAVPHVTPLKRVASPALNDVREEENPQKKLTSASAHSLVIPDSLQEQRRLEFNVFSQPPPTRSSGVVHEKNHSTTLSPSPSNYPQMLSSLHTTLLSKLVAAQQEAAQIQTDGTNESFRHSTNVLAQIRNLLETIQAVDGAQQ